VTVPTTANIAVPFVSALSEVLTTRIQQHPERIAIGTSDLQTTSTYGQLDTLVRSAITQMSRLGLKRGHTIALLSDNSVEFVVGLLALIFSGARVAPVNPALTSTELTTRLAQLPATALLVTRHLANKPGFGKSIPPALPTGSWSSRGRAVPPRCESCTRKGPLAHRARRPSPIVRLTVTTSPS
jgi:acyl-CoA synthetase (AMP-forming)/AMP-acid ligase II